MGREEIVSRIKANLDVLPTQMQAVARFIIDHPSDVALLSMREQARKAGVPPASMTRLAQRLGYTGYQALRDAYIEAMRDNVSWFSGRAVGLLSRRQAVGDTALVGEMARAITGNIEQLGRPAESAALLKAADVLHKARRVFCIGTRSSYPVAFLFSYTLNYFSQNALLLDGPGGIGVDLLRSASKSDALLAVSFSPYARATHDAVEMARDAGVSVVAVTDSEFAPVARHAEAVILVSVRSPSFFDTISPALAATEILVALLAARAGGDVPARVRVHERHLQAAGAFWEAKGASHRNGKRP